MFGRSLFLTLLLILNNFVHMSKGQIKLLFTKTHKDMKSVGLQYSESTHCNIHLKSMYQYQYGGKSFKNTGNFVCRNILDI